MTQGGVASAKSLNAVIDRIFRRDKPEDSPEPAPAMPVASPAGTKPGVRAGGEPVPGPAAGKEIVSAGRLQFIGLGALREHLGEKWERFRTAVHNIAEDVLRRRLTEKDVFTRQEDEGYVVVFAELSGEEARVKGAIIAREIQEQILGDSAGEDCISVNCEVRDLDSASLVKRDDIAATLDRALAGAPETVAAAEPVARDAAPEERPVPDRAGAGSAPTREPQNDISPIWDLRKNAILAFMIEPVTIGAEVVGARENLGPRPDPEMCLEFDLASIQALIGNIEALDDLHKRFLLLTRVHFETLTSSALQIPYFEMLRSIPKHWRDLLVLEVDGLPKGVVQSRIQRLVDNARKHCRSVRCRVTLPPADLANLGYSGLEAVGPNLREASVPEATKMAWLESFALAAKSARHATFVHGVDTPSLATTAVCAGYNFMSGDAIHPRVQELDNARRFEPSDLVARILAA